MSIIGDISDPKKDAAALQPVLDEVTDRAAAALKAALMDVLDGLQITITILRKGQQ